MVRLIHYLHMKMQEMREMYVRLNLAYTSK